MSPFPGAPERASQGALLADRPERRRGRGAALLALAVALGPVVLLLTGCRLLEEPPGAADSSVRAAATPLPRRAVLTATGVPTPTRPPLPARTPTPELADESELQQSVAEARSRLERVLGSSSLPGIEQLLVETVALAAPTGGEQLPHDTAARWLRQRATERLRLLQFERHQHQALIVVATQGWMAIPPLTTAELGFTLRRYDARGAQDSEHGAWLIDVFEAE